MTRIVAILLYSGAATGNALPPDRAKRIVQRFTPHTYRRSPFTPPYHTLP